MDTLSVSARVVIEHLQHHHLRGEGAHAPREKAFQYIVAAIIVVAICFLLTLTVKMWRAHHAPRDQAREHLVVPPFEAPVHEARANKVEFAQIGSALAPDAAEAQQRAVSKLQEMFPEMDPHALHNFLIAASGHLERAAQVLASVRDTRLLASPLSPWANTGTLQLRPPLATVVWPEILQRSTYDRDIAARFRKKCSRETLLRVASIWRRRSVGRTDPSDSLSSPTASQRVLDEQFCDLPSDAQVAVGRQLLRQRCQFHGLREVQMEHDGNCQFRAISQELFGTQTYHASVRAKIATYMRDHASEYRTLVHDEEIQRFGRDGVWGEEVTLAAAAHAFGIKVHVITSSIGENWHLEYSFGGVSELGREVFLTYLAPLHYNALEAAC
mmetsp:Transcript_84561/g.213250  ORF Transcript_84561/g.213250 Transcript_84561/m.213250 type:complete len:385 (+) Transcript_84561:76-1230(+)